MKIYSMQVKYMILDKKECEEKTDVKIVVKLLITMQPILCCFCKFAYFKGTSIL